MANNLMHDQVDLAADDSMDESVGSENGDVDDGRSQAASIFSHSSQLFGSDEDGDEREERDDVSTVSSSAQRRKRSGTPGAQCQRRRRIATAAAAASASNIPATPSARKDAAELKPNKHPIRIAASTLNGSWILPNNLDDVKFSDEIRVTREPEIITNACLIARSVVVNIPNAILPTNGTLGNITTSNITNDPSAIARSSSIAAILGMLVKHTDGQSPNGTSMSTPKQNTSSGRASRSRAGVGDEDSDEEMAEEEVAEKTPKKGKNDREVTSYIFPYIDANNEVQMLNMRFLAVETLLATKDEQDHLVDDDGGSRLRARDEKTFLKKQFKNYCDDSTMMSTAMEDFESVGIRVWLIVNDPNFDDSNGVARLMNANMYARQKRQMGGSSSRVGASPAMSSVGRSTVDSAARDVASEGEWQKVIENYTQGLNNIKTEEDDSNDTTPDIASMDVGNLMTSFYQYKKQMGVRHPLAPESVFDPVVNKNALTLGLYKTTRMGEIRRMNEKSIFEFQRSLSSYFPCEGRNSDHDLLIFRIPVFLVNANLFHILDPRMLSPLDIVLPPDPLRVSSCPATLLTCFREVRGKNDAGLLQAASDSRLTMNCYDAYVRGYASNSATCTSNFSMLRNFSAQMQQERNGTVKSPTQSKRSSNLLKELFQINSKKEDIINAWKGQAVEQSKMTYTHKFETLFPTSELGVFEVFKTMLKYYPQSIRQLFESVHEDGKSGSKYLAAALFYSSDNDSDYDYSYWVKHLYEDYETDDCDVAEECYDLQQSHLEDAVEKIEGLLSKINDRKLSYDLRAKVSPSISPIFAMVACERAQRAGHHASAFGLPPESTWESIKRSLNVSLKSFLETDVDSDPQPDWHKLSDRLVDSKDLAHNDLTMAALQRRIRAHGTTDLVDQVISLLDELCSKFIATISEWSAQGKPRPEARLYADTEVPLPLSCCTFQVAGVEFTNCKWPMSDPRRHKHDSRFHHMYNELMTIHSKAMNNTGAVIRVTEMRAFDEYMSSAIDSVEDLILNNKNLSAGLVQRYTEAVAYLRKRDKSVFGNQPLKSEFTCFGQAINDIVDFSHNVLHYGFGEMEKVHFLSLYFGSFEALINGTKMGIKTFGTKGNGKSEAMKQLSEAFVTSAIFQITNKSAMADNNGMTEYDSRFVYYDEQPDWTKRPSPQLEELKTIMSEGETHHQRTEERLDPQSSDPSRMYTNHIKTEHNEKYAMHSNVPSFADGSLEDVSALWHRFQLYFFHTNTHARKDWQQQLRNLQNAEQLDHFRTTECLMTIMVVLSNCIPAMRPNMQYLDVLHGLQEVSLKRFDTPRLTTRQHGHRRNAVLLQTALHAVQVCFHMRQQFVDLGLMSKPSSEFSGFDTHMFKQCAPLMKTSLAEIGTFSHAYTMAGSCSHSSIYDLVSLSVGAACCINPEDHIYVPVDAEDGSSDQFQMEPYTNISAIADSIARKDFSRRGTYTRQEIHERAHAHQKQFEDDLSHYLHKRALVHSLLGNTKSIQVNAEERAFGGMRPALARRFYSGVTATSTVELKTRLEMHSSFIARNRMGTVLFPTVSSEQLANNQYQFDYTRLYLPNCSTDTQVASLLIRSTFLREFHLTPEFVRDVLQFMRSHDVICMTYDPTAASPTPFKDDLASSSSSNGNDEFDDSDDEADGGPSGRVDSIVNQLKTYQSLCSTRVDDEQEGHEGRDELDNLVTDAFSIYPSRQLDASFMKMTMDSEDPNAKFSTFYHNMSGVYCKRPAIGWDHIQSKSTVGATHGANDGSANGDGRDPSADASSFGSKSHNRLHVNVPFFMRFRDSIMLASLRCANHPQVCGYQDPRMRVPGMCTPIFPQMLMYAKYEQMMLDTVWAPKKKDGDERVTHYITICDNPKQRDEMLAIRLQHKEQQNTQDASMIPPTRSIFKYWSNSGCTNLLSDEAQAYNDDDPPDWQDEKYIEFRIAISQIEEDPFLEFSQNSLARNNMLGYSSVDFSNPSWDQRSQNARTTSVELIKELIDPDKLRKKCNSLKLGQQAAARRGTSRRSFHRTHDARPGSLNYHFGNSSNVGLNSLDFLH